MKAATAVLAIILTGMLSIFAVPILDAGPAPNANPPETPTSSPQTDFTTAFLQKVSLFSPFTDRSTRDVVEEGKEPDFTPATASDPFGYVPHRELKVPEGAKVMVFVPHPDDESIAAAGLIQRVVEKHGEVRVVWVTSGDGYAQAVGQKVRNAHLCAKDFIEYGKKRQEEALQAICEMGLPPGAATFLGFPDTGIDDLWESYWSNLKPFISPFTLFDRPHLKGKNRWVKYSGVDLSEELERVLLEFQPDWVVLPDPRDQHPDHAAAGVFVLAALRSIYNDAKTPYMPGQVLTYVVHFKDYPHGREWVKPIGTAGVGGSQASGKTLSKAEWVSLPLSAEEVEGKRRALLAHSSQLQMLQGFFKNFLLPCELYGTLNLVQTIAVPQEYAAHFGHPPGPDEEEEETTLTP